MFNDSTFNCQEVKRLLFFSSSKFSRKGLARSNIPNSKTVWRFKENNMIMILNQIQNRILIEHFLTT
jgi:hypothetical protein